MGHVSVHGMSERGLKKASSPTSSNRHPIPSNRRRLLSNCRRLPSNSFFKHNTCRGCVPALDGVCGYMSLELIQHVTRSVRCRSLTFRPVYLHNREHRERTPPQMQEASSVEQDRSKGVHRALCPHCAERSRF